VVAFQRPQTGPAREPPQAEVQAQPAVGARDPADDRLQRRGQHRAARAQPGGGVGGIAAEELVAALPRQDDLHVAGGQPRREPVRQRCGVAARLVGVARDALEQRRVLRADHELAVVRAVATGDEARVGQLVERRPRRTRR
jgi:hypothetical protein